MGLPPGKLICTQNGKNYKWYQSDGHEKIYIPKKNHELAEQLAVKRYLQTREQNLLHEISSLEFYFRHYKEDQQAELMLIDPRYSKLLFSYIQPISKELSDWMNAPYEKNDKYRDQLIHRTVEGIYVRSKSEAIIVMTLAKHQIPFRYECKLELGDIILYPDFTIRHPKTGETYYWEHFGIMDDPDYRRNTLSKLELYSAHDIYPSVQLLTTFETKNHPLASDLVENMVKYYFLEA